MVVLLVPLCQRREGLRSVNLTYQHDMSISNISFKFMITSSINQMGLSLIFNCKNMDLLWQASCIGCVGFAGFSLVVDKIMGPH